MLFRFCAYGFLKNQRYFEPFLILIFLQMGLSYLWIGVLIACRGLTVNLLEVPSGAIADSWGRRGCMIVSFVSYIISFLIFAFADVFGWLLVAMIVYGVGDTFRTGTHKAMIFEWLRLQDREEERTKFYGLTRSWSKIGSAVSSLIAAAFVVYTQDYRAIFLLAIVPYALNIINFLGYPPELDGEHKKNISISDAARRLKRSLAAAFKQRGLRRLISESMGWDGIFQAVKDYLQPALAAFVVVSLAQFQWMAGLSEVQRTAVLLGIVYTALFLVSGAASRSSHRLASFAGSDRGAAVLLWWGNLLVFAVLIVADLSEWLLIVVATFVAMHILQNFWRPILISRFDEHAIPADGATILSIESQSQRIATLVVAPLMGFSIDWVQLQQWPGQFWPIGIIGGGAALLLILTNKLHRQN